MLGDLSLFLLPAVFFVFLFLKSTFKTNLSGIPPVSNSFDPDRPDTLSDLIWVTNYYLKSMSAGDKNRHLQGNGRIGCIFKPDRLSET